MGEVYRAHDKKLGRDVAIKVLPEEFARDKQRLTKRSNKDDPTKLHLVTNWFQELTEREMTDN